METFVEAKPFVSHQSYSLNREDTLAALDMDAIDGPIVDIVSALAKRPCCFPLQSCVGHFLCAPDQDRFSLASMPEGYEGPVTYRIAYLALCIENSQKGRILRGALEKIAGLDPDYIQFGSADWFWRQFVNSYVLQVEPACHKEKDQAVLDAGEARHVQRVRDRFFTALRNRLCRT